MADRWSPRPSGGGGRPSSPSRWPSGSWSRGTRRPGGEGPPAGGRPRQPGRFAVGPGFPWPLLSVAALVVTSLLAWFLQQRAGLLGLLFPVGYLVVCLLAVCAVRADGVLVPAVQAPVVAFLGLAVSAVLSGNATSTTLFVLGVFAPLAQLFWWMLVAFVACAILGFLRRREADPSFSVLGAVRGVRNA
ncbi:DUF6542 domain-containing protein [Actinomycetospora termitidis]|uniref:DUF6542 domain-containing protein n=1 Tax=Actinomycetospora termitidis TaxID=3053470 RepID=A0ABT7ME56_9PSEU|nr:DUF6542 domain-containing protein [Actinomycetospora sp. Odt1-22]MDL5158459.1 hypothetical protein [Actinomycetospora sp. Odt1-22]